MITRPSLLTHAALLASGVWLAATPASAQDAAGERVNMVIAYSEDECPEQTAENEIVICEILVEAERYRIPSNLRLSDSPQNRSRVREVEKLKYVGDFGAFSCSPAGAGGFTGCNQKFIESAYEEKEESETVRFAQLIEEARQERLSTIDADAAAEQVRVEAIEREYLERLERERAAPLPGEEELPGGVLNPVGDAPATADAPSPSNSAPSNPPASEVRASPPPAIGPTLTEEGDD